MMVKQKDKGYTILEILLVLAIISCISCMGLYRIATVYADVRLDSQLQLLSSIVTRAKIKGLLQHQASYIYVFEKYIMYDGIVYDNITGVTCDNEYVIVYTENGNIRKNATITYYCAEKQSRLVFWLGGGSFEVR